MSPKYALTQVQQFTSIFYCAHQFHLHPLLSLHYVLFFLISTFLFIVTLAISFKTLILKIKYLTKTPPLNLHLTLASTVFSSPCLYFLHKYFNFPGMPKSYGLNKIALSWMTGFYLTVF